MTKIGNVFYVLVLLNENAHGTTQSKPSKHDPSLIVHIPYLLLANKNQKCDKKGFKTKVRMASQILVNERVKNKAVTQFCSHHLNI